MVIATAPPLACGNLAKLMTRDLSATDTHIKAERLTAALDPDKTCPHERFVQALAKALDTAAVKLLLTVHVEAAAEEAALVAQVRKPGPTPTACCWPV